MRNLRPWLAASLMAALSTLSACTTADVATPVTAFAKAATDAKGVLDKRQADIDKAILDEGASKVAARGTQAALKWDGCVAGTDHCRLYTEVATSLGSLKWPVSNSQLSHGVNDLMAEMVAYSVALAAIANAKTVAEVEAQLGATKASIARFAAAADKVAGLGLTPVAARYSGPVFDLISFGARRYIEYRKMTALRAAVDEMEPLLGGITTAFTLVASEQAAIQQAALDDRFTDAYGAYVRAPADRNAVIRLRTVADEYDLILGTKPTVVFDTLAAAHTALADALHRRDMTFEQLWPYLQAIFAETQKFAEIVKALETAAAAKT